MLPLFATVFVASLLGSLHCVGMCGPLAILASSGSAELRGSHNRSHHRSRRANLPAVVAYHASRVVSYSIAGIIVGMIGAGIQETGSLLGVQRLAAQLAGGSMLVIGLMGIVRLVSGVGHSAMLPIWMQRQLSHWHTWARRQPPIRRAATVGLLTAILPCGWLYAFLIVAAGTASSIQGGLVMAIFALGSVPALAGMAVSVTLMMGQFRKAIPWCSAILVTVVGASTVLHRSHVKLDVMNRASPSVTESSLISRVEKIDQVALPCCQKQAD